MHRPLEMVDLDDPFVHDGICHRSHLLNPQNRVSS
jgi:hypothetical protein